VVEYITRSRTIVTAERIDLSFRGRPQPPGTACNRIRRTPMYTRRWGKWSRVFLQLVHGENRKVYKYLCTPFEISWFDEVYDRMYSDGPPVAGANDLGVYTRL